MNTDEFVMDVRFVPLQKNKRFNIYAQITHVASSDQIQNSWFDTDYLTGAAMSYAWFLATLGGVNADPRIEADKAGKLYRQHPLW